MRLKEIDLIVKEHEIKYDGREKLIEEDIFRCSEIACNTADKLKKLLIEYFSLYKDEKERFITMMFDTKLKLIGVNLVSVGSINNVPAHPREVFRPAILTGARSIIVAHNHPSGSTEPSSEDIGLTRRLISAGELIGIELNDSFIVSTSRGREACRSMRECNDI